MIAVANLSKAFGSQALFSEVSLQFNAGERYGLVGANGSGKSTLLRIIAGDELPSDGTVSIPKRCRLGVLRQDHYQYEDTPILDVVMMGHQELWEAMEEKQRLLDRADVEFDADRYAELEDVVVRHDGYAMEARAAEVLEGLGIETAVHREPLSVLSGGFKLRVLLAQALASNPDALLLDEPTNHLDILSIRWLEKFLGDYSGCAIVVSHDHRFLDNVCTQIADVDYETVMLYTGNYTEFEELKIEDRDRKEAEIAKQEKEIAHHKAFVERFRAKATKARQAQSKLKLIDRIQIDRLPRSSRRYPTFKFRQCRPSGKEVFTAEGISKAYGDLEVLRDVALQVRRGDRLAIIGPNGIGKSTLLKIMVGSLEADDGEAEWGYETHVGYFAQDHKELLGEARDTVENWLWNYCAGEPIGFVRGKLAEVLFSGDEVKKKVSSLSGGEGARLIFSRLSVQEPNVLLLDEPTNHLDLEAIRALVEGLEKFEGTLVLVSHDRWFVSKLATRILEITPTGVVDFPGGYDEYVERCGDDHLDADTVVLRARRDKRKKQRGGGNGKGDDSAASVSTLRRRRDELTEKIERAESRINEINESFCDPTFFEQTAGKKVKQLENEQRELRDRVEAWMTEWEKVESQLESVSEPTI